MRNRSFVPFIVLLNLCTIPVQVCAETIALIGTGEVSEALGPRFAELGHIVIFGSRSPERDEVRELVRRSGENASATTAVEAASKADIVMLNVPWSVAEEVTVNLGDLSGKIILDPINPRVVAGDGFRDYPTHTSNAERIQNLAPTAFVVKAFNTMSTETMIDPDLYDHPITIPIVGNDAAAKAKVTHLLESMGYEVVDVGPVQFAHIVEGLYLIRANAREQMDQAFEYHFLKRQSAARPEH